MIIPVYKPLGQSTHLLANKVGKSVGEKATHTGTLDPMAEGIIVVLTGNDRFHKANFSSVKKTYDFEVLVGFATDTHDLLGLITESQEIKVNVNQLAQDVKKVFSKIKNQSEQILPEFSAKRYQGESYFNLAKKGQVLPEVKSKIKIFNLDILSTDIISKNKLDQEIRRRVGLIKGSFRQKEILKNWSMVLEDSAFSHFALLKCQAETSKRTYIRGIVRDLSQELEMPCTTYSIIRSKHGDFNMTETTCFI